MSRAIILAALLAAGCAAFPAPQAQQLALRDRQDAPAMRQHAWALLERVTRPDRTGLPAWESWSPLARTFGHETGNVRPFRLVEEPEVPGVALLQASGEPLLSLVLFNPAADRHIRENGLFRRATLDSINARFDPGTPLAQRQIPPFPRDAMAMKTVWAVVREAGITPISVWDGGDAGEGENPPARWPRTVAVDPSLPGSLDRFYHVRIAPQDIASVRAIDPDARPGDYLILLGLHLTTKEIPDWVWTTYWWHDRPDEGPYAADRPAALAGPWRNYLMDVAYSMETPREADGTPNIAFNPYFEVFPAGTRSNCMACHQGAVWTASGAPPFLPVTRGARVANDPRFAGATRLDFMWSIATEAR